MEQTSSQQLKVGVFLVIGLIMTSISVFLLGADKALFTSYIKVYALFDQVQGLDNGSVVSLSGVTVGNVEKIEFVPSSHQLKVTLRIDENYSSQIPKDSQVEIRTQGALGDKFVYIIQGDYKSGQISEGSEIKVLPAADIFGILSARGNETERIFDILADVHQITKTLVKENRIERMATDFSMTAKNLKEASEHIQKITSQVDYKNMSKDINDSLSKLNRVVTKIDQGQGTLGLLINDSSLHDQLKELTGGSKRQEHIKGAVRSSLKD
ncbi:MAG: MlaD family protein [Bdellovibrionia bacterium]